MEKKTLTLDILNNYTSSKNEEYINLYTNLPKIFKMITKLKKINFYLIDKEDSPTENVSKDIMNKAFAINLGKTTFDDAEFFHGLPENLQKSTQYVIMIDSIIGNLIYYLLVFNKQKAKYYIDNFTILSLFYQKAIFKTLVKHVYGTSYDPQILDKVMIVATYSLYRFIYDYNHEMAKVAAVDLLMNSDLLNKSFKSRVKLSILANNLLRYPNAKNLYDALYHAGFFMEFTTAKNFLRALANVYDIRLIKILFTNYNFKLQKDKQGFYVYKIIITTISDVLQNWKQYNKFKRELTHEFRTSRLLIEQMIKDAAVTLQKVIY